MSIYSISGLGPNLDPGAWIAPGAVVVGRVALARGASVWFGSVLRGDTEWIRVGEDSNVQDGCVVHADEGIPTTIGARATVGHKVMLHGCTIEDECLIGIGAILLNHSKIGRHSIVGAGALVPQGKVIPERSLVLGSPARVARTLTEKDLEMIHYAARHYAENAARFRETLVPFVR